MDDPAANQPELNGVDWWSLNRRLLSCAITWFRDRGCSGADSLLPNTGMSARDLVSNAIVQIMAEDKWRQASSPDGLFRLAYTIARRDFLDLVKDKEYKQTLITDSIDAKHSESLIGSLSGAKDVLDAAEASALIKSLESVLDGDEMVKAYLYLWLRKGIGKREDIAHLLGVSEREATDIRRRLLYKVRRSLTPDMVRGDRTKV